VLLNERVSQLCFLLKPTASKTSCSLRATSNFPSQPLDLGFWLSLVALPNKCLLTVILQAMSPFVDDPDW